MFAKWGRFAYRHRGLVPLVIVALIAILYGVFGTQLGNRLDTEGWDDPGSSATKAAAIETKTFGRDTSGDVVVLIDAPEGKTVDDVAPAVTARLKELQSKHPDQIASTQSYEGVPQMATADKKRAFVSIGIKGDGADVLKNYREVKDEITFDGVSTKVAGGEPIADTLDEGMAGDIKRAEVLGLPLVGVLLLVVFGGVVAALMPLLVGVLSILGSLGILTLITYTTTVNTFAQSVVTLLGLGLAIDYGLFMVSRFREELSEGMSVPDAVANTTATAGKTVLTSALMVAVALSGLLLFPQAFLKSVAYGAMSAVGLAALLSLTVLPSLFGLLGTRINALSVRKSAGSRSREATVSSVWGRVPAWAMRHSSLVTIVVVAGLLALAIPLNGIKFGGINETYLPPNDTTRQAQQDFDETFPTFRTSPVKLVVSGASPQQLASIYQEANAVDGLTERFKPSHPTKDGVTVLAAGIKDRDDNKRIVEKLHSIKAPDGVSIEVGGTPALEQESIQALFDKLPWMFLYIIVVTFILMSLAFGSVILPAKAIIMTILGLGSTLGILTAMFVDGVGANLANFSPGPLMSPVLVLIMAIIYGLSTDYEVFLISRMVEDRERGANTPHAIRFGTATTGGIITAAALIMIVVCGVFGFSTIVMMKYIAFGMIAALLLDATIIRMVLVPAVMYLLRDDCWWAPRWVKVLSARLGHGAALAGQPAGAGAARTAVAPAMPAIAPATAGPVVTPAASTPAQASTAPVTSVPVTPSSPAAAAAPAMPQVPETPETPQAPHPSVPAPATPPTPPAPESEAEQSGEHSLALDYSSQGEPIGRLPGRMTVAEILDSHEHSTLRRDIEDAIARDDAKKSAEDRRGERSLPFNQLMKQLQAGESSEEGPRQNTSRDQNGEPEQDNDRKRFDERLWKDHGGHSDL